MKTISLRALTLTLLAGVLVVGAFVAGCEYPTGTRYGNAPPETQLSNVPPNDTIAQYIRLGLIPEFTVSWLGNDADGYVTAFRYRWTDIRVNGSSFTRPWTTILNISAIAGQPLLNTIFVTGQQSSIFRIYDYIVTLNAQDPKDTEVIRAIIDSLATLRTFAVPYQTGPIPGDSIAGADPVTNPTPNKGIFIFSSPDTANRHYFEVQAIDNINTEDPTPDGVNFWTLTSPGPTFRIDGVPLPNSLAIRYPTELWRGLRFSFVSIDPSTFDIAYQYSIDDTLHWSPLSIANQVYVTAAEFRSGTNTHILYARARNRWGVYSPVDTAMFTAVVPVFDDPAAEHRTLLINNDFKLSSSPPGTPDSNVVKAFYTDIMNGIGKTGKYDIWTTQSRPANNNWPSRTVIAQYAVVVLISEFRGIQLGGAAYKIDDAKQSVLREHLGVGGKLVVSAPPDPEQTFPSYRTWSYDVYHAGAFRTSTERDFVGARGRLGYPDLRLDTAKVHKDSVAANGQRAMRLIAQHAPRGFGELIYNYDSATDRPGWETAPLGIRFISPPPIPPARQTYSVVFFGLPLYYMEKPSAQEALRVAFQDLNEL